MSRDASHRNGVPARKLGCVLLLMLPLSCTESQATVTLEVYSWWQESSEKAAFEEVRTIHRRDYPHVELRNLAGENAAAPDTRELMAGRMLAGAPPATFQANLGADLLRWTVVETRKYPVGSLDEPANSYRLIQGLSDLDLQSKVRPGLFENLTVAPEAVPFGVPINVHRLNVIYYRTDKLAEFQSRPGNAEKSFLDLETLCPEGDYDPDDPALALDLDIVIGAGRDGQAWTLTLLTFENVLPAILARRLGNSASASTFYRDLFSGRLPGARDPRTGASAYVREALECVQYLSRWFRRTPAGTYDADVGWAEAVDAVMDDAAFTVMGDWANGLIFDELALFFSPQVMSRAFPGTEGLFVYTSDAFPLPRDVDHSDHARDLLRTIASAEAQVAFSRKKGSIPALRSADLSDLHEWQKAAAEAFDSSQHLLATSGYFPPYYPQNELQDALVAMTDWNVVRRDATPEQRAKRRVLVDAALGVFTRAEWLLGFWQDRLADGVASDPLP